MARIIVVGGGQAGSSLVAKLRALGFDEEVMLPANERKALARVYYERAGFSREEPVEFELRYNSSDLQARIALAIQSMWDSTLGAKASLANEEFRVLVANILQRDGIQVCRLSWSADYNDADSFLRQFHSGDPSNFTGLKDQKFDELLDKSARELDTAKRAELLAAAESRLLELQPVIPIYFYVSKHLVRTDIEGWTDNVMDVHLSRHLRQRDRAPTRDQSR